MSSKKNYVFVIFDVIKLLVFFFFIYVIYNLRISGF